MQTITKQVSCRCASSQLEGAYLRFLQTALGEVPSEPPTPGKFCRFGGRGKPLWALLFEDGEGGTAGDWRTGSVHVWQSSTSDDGGLKNPRVLAALQHARQQREHEQRLRWAQRAQKLRKLWAESLPVLGNSPAARYLMNRLGMSTWPLPLLPHLNKGSALRYASQLPYFTDDGQPCGQPPAMLAALTNPHGELVAIHRTWLTPEGRKADVPGPVKKLTPTCGPLAGAGIALFSGPDAWGRIGIAEGIETALAASLGAGLPVCAAYSANNLAAWCWPTGTRRLVIFADHDQAGQKAAQALLMRAQAAGVQAIVRTPSEPGLDWCDVWAQRDAKEVQA